MAYINSALMLNLILVYQTKTEESCTLTSTSTSYTENISGNGCASMAFQQRISPSFQIKRNDDRKAS